MSAERRYVDTLLPTSAAQDAAHGLSLDPLSVGRGGIDPEAVLEAAVSFVMRGWGAFPVDARSKAPKFRRGAHPRWAADPNGPAGLSCASWCAQDVERHWPLARGVAVGLVPPVGVAIIDADEKHRPGIVREVRERHPGLADGGHHVTRFDGGHFPGRVPAGMTLPQSVDPGLGIDVRLGLRGYVVAPPCPGYSIVRPFAHVGDLPDLPLELVELLTKGSVTASEQLRNDGANAINGGRDRLQHYVWAAVKGEHDAVAAAPEGARNTTLHRSAVKLGSLVGAGMLSEADALDALLAGAQAATDPLPRHEASRTARSGLRYGVANPRQLDRGEP